MSKPDNISQAIWDAATAVVFEIGESEEHDTLPIALALSQAYSRGLEDSANHCAIAATNTTYEDIEEVLLKAAFEIRALGSK